jgi:serine/threonine-protein kinase RsbW
MGTKDHYSGWAAGERWDPNVKRANAGAPLVLRRLVKTGYANDRPDADGADPCRMTDAHTIRIEFGSAFDMVDFVQVVSDYVGRMAGLDDDALHWVSVAVRESVVNAIKHGNQNDESKRVTVEFTPVPPHDPQELVIRVEDEGEGFDPEEIADPLAPENILKSSGRGIFLIRSFMDDVELQRGKHRGMQIRMVKKVARNGASA